MNNIEILEERINFCKNNTECREELNQCFGCTFEIEEIQAIENLIQEYKELKEKINVLNQEKEYLNTIIDSDNDNYIPKSKLKEKIEELDKEMAKDEVDEFGIHSQGWAALDWTRDFLLKLLEEGE